MGDHQGGGSFGFAPQGGSARRQADESLATPMRERTAEPVRPRITPSPYQQPSEKPLWLWLIIGVLIGIGGTLLTSSFWLPERQSINLAEHDVIDEAGLAGNEALAAGVAKRATDTATGSPPSEEADVVTDTNGVASVSSSPEEPETPSVEAQLAALDAQEALVQPEAAEVIEVTEAIEVTEVAEVTESKEEPTPAPIQTAASRALEVELPKDSKPPSPTPKTERLLPAGAADADTGDGETPEVNKQAASEAQVPEPQEQEEPASRQLAAASAAAFESSDVGAGWDTAINEAREQPEDPAPEIVERKPSDAFDLARLSPVQESVQAAPARSSSRGAVRNGLQYRVQLAAVNDEAAARIYWREVNERLPGVFSNVEPVFNQRVVDQRLYLRIWVGSFESRGEADNYCSWLKEQGQDCFVTRVDNL